jgi:hypothetical protein
MMSLASCVVAKVPNILELDNSNEREFNESAFSRSNDLVVFQLQNSTLAVLKILVREILPKTIGLFTLNLQSMMFF